MNKKYLIISIGITALIVGGALYFSYEPEMGNAMSLTDKYEQATEIKAKYQLDGATLKTTPKDDPKDRIEVWIGEKSDKEVLGAETNFEPKLTIARWDSEVEFSIKPKAFDEVALKDRTLKFDKEKILFDTPKMNFEIYEYTDGEKGGHKFVWYLNEKPASNVVEFAIESDGLDFFYQPELTQEEINEGAFRPENVVGSYAVYHSTKGRINDVYGKDYKVGKAFHIYRPHLYDADGKEAWGNLHIENGIYSVEIPQDFIDKAVYPIKSNDDFGYRNGDVPGGTEQNLNDDLIFCFHPYAPAFAGDASSMTVYIKRLSVGDTFSLGFYKDSDNSRAGYTDEGTTPASASWIELNIASGGTVIAVDYLLCTWVETGSGRYYWDVGAGKNVSFSVDTYDYDWPTTLSWTAENWQLDRKYSIYVTYTPDAPPVTEETKKQDVIWFD